MAKGNPLPGEPFDKNLFDHLIRDLTPLPPNPLAVSDLVPQNINLSSSTLAPGQSFRVDWLLANIGAADANAASTTVVRITRSPTSAFSPSNLAGVDTAALPPGTSVAQFANLIAPITQGTYYVWVIADDFSKVTNQGQANLANDFQPSAAFTEHADMGALNLKVPHFDLSELPQMTEDEQLEHRCQMIYHYCIYPEPLKGRRAFQQFMRLEVTTWKLPLRQKTQLSQDSKLLLRCHRVLPCWPLSTLFAPYCNARSIVTSYTISGNPGSSLTPVLV